MKKHTKMISVIWIFVGLIGMASYQVILSYPHPAIMEGKLFHALWLAFFLIVEMRGIFQLRAMLKGSEK